MKEGFELTRVNGGTIDLKLRYAQGSRNGETKKKIV